MSTGRDLMEKLTYNGMSRAIRRLALKDKLADAEDLAVMAEADVCALVAKEYEIVYSENERLGLVRKDKLDEYKNLVQVISR